MASVKLHVHTKSGDTIIDYLKKSGVLVQSAYVNGDWIKSSTADVIAVTNPFDGSFIGTVPIIDEAGITQSIDAAEETFQSWSQLLPQQRAQKLRVWGELIAPPAFLIGLRAPQNARPHWVSPHISKVQI